MAAAGELIAQRDAALAAKDTAMVQLAAEAAEVKRLRSQLAALGKAAQ